MTSRIRGARNHSRIKCGPPPNPTCSHRGGTSCQESHYGLHPAICEAPQSGIAPGTGDPRPGSERGGRQGPRPQRRGAQITLRAEFTTLTSGGRDVRPPVALAELLAGVSSAP